MKYVERDVSVQRDKQVENCSEIVVRINVGTSLI